MTDNSEPRKWEVAGTGPGTPPPAGAYSPAVRAGSLLFVSGQVPRDPDTGAIVGRDVRTQARQVLDNLAAVLQASGASLTDVVSITVYLANEDDWGAYNEVHMTYFDTPYPARAVVGAQLRGILVEVSAIAVA
jgi:2-iminobutanoate/2-iminopropanoate deaminase